MKSVILLFLFAACTYAQYEYWPPYWYPFFPAYPPYGIPYQPPTYPNYYTGGLPGGYGYGRPPPPYYPQIPIPAPPQQSSGGDEYAASLGGAPVGFYSRRQNTGPYGTNTEVSGVSLSNAKVGIYGKDGPASNPGFPGWIGR